MDEPELDTPAVLPSPDEVIETFGGSVEEEGSSTTVERGKKYDGGEIPRQ